MGQSKAVQLSLVPHSAHPPSSPPFRLWASVEHSASFGAMATTNIWFGIGAPAERFLIQQSPEPGRVDGLWRTTCFEAFLREEGDDAYREYNFAPSGDWAAYDFASYRDPLGDSEVGAAPYIRIEDNLTWWSFGATIAIEAGKRWQLGLSAVIEEKDGTRSYWALAHSPGKPDFHHPDCFAARLP